jgi:uncharacterized protein YuzE
VKISYDIAAGAMYAQFRAGRVARTVEVDGEALVDLDEHGQALGVEVLAFHRPWPLDEVRPFGISDKDARILGAMKPPVMTVG